MKIYQENEKRTPQAKHDLFSLLKEFTQTREKREKERMQELREMHGEKINVMGGFLEVFEKSFKKNRDDFGF